MKNKVSIFFTAFIVLCALSVEGQSVERSVISSIGFAYSGPAVQSSCTVGEAITFTTQNDSFIATQGFQQPSAEDDLCIGGSNTILNINACTSYQLNDSSYTTSGTYTQEWITAEGCDSIITLNLVIDELNNDVTLTENTLTALQDDASYMWFDCGTEMIVGAGQSFTPATNGLYQVQITQEGCITSSACIEVIVDDITENTYSLAMKLYPNPTRDIVYLEISGITGTAEMKLFDAAGKQVMQQNLFSTITPLPLSNLAAGVYLVAVRSGTQLLHLSLIKE